MECCDSYRHWQPGAEAKRIAGKRRDCKGSTKSEGCEGQGKRKGKKQGQSKFGCQQKLWRRRYRRYTGLRREAMDSGRKRKRFGQDPVNLELFRTKPVSTSEKIAEEVFLEDIQPAVRRSSLRCGAEIQPAVRREADTELDSGHWASNTELCHRQCGEIIDNMEINLVTVAYTLVGVGFFPTGEVMGMMLLGHGQSSDICIDVIVFVLMY
jgi:hypothetical protein